MGPINPIIDIRIQVVFEPLNSFVVIRNIALKVVIIDQKHKMINDKIIICFIKISNLNRFVLNVFFLIKFLLHF